MFVAGILSATLPSPEVHQERVVEIGEVVVVAEEVDVGVEVGVDGGAPPEVVAGEAAEGA